MARNAEIAFAWGDGTYSFRLAFGELAELQEKTGVGPQLLLSRLIDGSWRVADAYDTIRLGLIGGGKSPVEALTLCDRYVRERPLLESLSPAKAILLAALSGVEGEEWPGKDGSGATQAGDLSPTDGSISPDSTDKPL